jgi:hypothetical protein
VYIIFSFVSSWGLGDIWKGLVLISFGQFRFLEEKNCNFFYLKGKNCNFVACQDRNVSCDYHTSAWEPELSHNITS